MAPSRGRSASRKSSCSLPLLLIVLTIIIQCGLSFVWAWLRKTPIAAGEHVQQQQQQRQQSSPRAPATVIVALRIDQIVLHRMAEPRPCATLDWWPDSKCDFGACSWVNATANSLDLNDPFLVQAAKALAPLTLRLGGSLADQMTYAGIPGSAASPATCDGLDFKPDLRQRVGFTGGCISWRRWLELLSFVRSSNAVSSSESMRCVGVSERSARQASSVARCSRDDRLARRAAAPLRAAGSQRTCARCSERQLRRAIGSRA